MILDQNKVTNLMLLEILGNLQIKDAIISIKRVDDTLIFTNQAKESFKFELQNIDVDKVAVKILVSAKDYSDDQIKKTKIQIYESLTKLSKTNLDSIKTVNTKIVSDINALSQFTNKKIDTLNNKFSDYITKANSTKQIESLDKSTTSKLNTIETSIDSLQKKDEFIVSKVDEFYDFIENINLDFVQDVKFKDRYAYVTKNGETKKYLLPASVIYTGGGGGGEASEFKYTNNLPTPRRIGGVPKGSTFDNASLKSLFNLLFYGADEPYFSTFNINYKVVYEVGELITNESKQAFWGLNNTELLEVNSINIKYKNENILVGENLQNSGSYTFISPEILFTTETKVEFTISGNTTTENEFEYLFSFYYKHRIYIGSNDLEVVTQEDIKLLQLTNLTDTIEGKYSIDASGYKWVCYPKSFGLKLNFKDLETDIDIEMQDAVTVVLTNIYGVVIEYFCHRSFNKLGASIQVLIS